MALSQQAQATITPAAALARLKAGNERFVTGARLTRDFQAEVEQTATGQYPFAAILTCIDSRVAPEIVFDQGVGDLFVTRVAGEAVNNDTLGSLEFAARFGGAKLIAVMGHTMCGAIQGACDGIQLGLLTATLARLTPAVDAVKGRYSPRSSANLEFVQAVADMNVRLSIRAIRTTSTVLREMIDGGEIGLVGAMYDVHTGKVAFAE